MTVNLHGIPAARAPPPRMPGGIPPEHRGPALAEAVHVHDGAQPAELVKFGGRRRFQHGSFGALAVAQEHVGPVVGRDAPRIERGAHARADALAKRPRGHVHPRQSRRGMAFEIGVELPETQQRRTGHDASFSPRGIQHGRGVPLRQDEAIVVGAMRIVGIEAHLVKEQDRNDLRS